MLKIRLVDEYWDSETNIFSYENEYVLRLEHSLISLWKWEARWRKSFLFTKEMTNEETLDYIRCMTLNPDPPDSVYERLSPEDRQKVVEYINNPMTASYFPDSKDEHGRSEIVTAELIYYWMVTYRIPFECEKWHLSRLLNLIRTCTIKNSTPKKRSQKEIMAQNAAMNAARRKKLNTRG